MTNLGTDASDKYSVNSPSLTLIALIISLIWNVTPTVLGVGSNPIFATISVVSLTVLACLFIFKWEVTRRLPILGRVLLCEAVFTCTCFLTVQHLHQQWQAHSLAKADYDKKWNDATHLTMLQLATQDFPQCFTMKKIVFNVVKNSIPSHVYGMTYYNIDENALFVGFYVPDVPKAFDLMLQLPKATAVFANASNAVTVSHPENLQQESSSTAAFTKRVFIYTDATLQLAAVEEVRRRFAELGLLMIYRDDQHRSSVVSYRLQELGSQQLRETLTRLK